MYMNNCMSNKVLTICNTLNKNSHVHIYNISVYVYYIHTFVLYIMHHLYVKRNILFIMILIRFTSVGLSSYNLMSCFLIMLNDKNESNEITIITRLTNEKYGYNYALLSVCVKVKGV